MNDLQALVVKTMNDDGIESVPIGKEKPALTIIIGGCNSVHAHNVVQLNAEKLPETIDAVTNGLKEIDPEVAKTIGEPLGRLMDVIASLIFKSQA